MINLLKNTNPDSQHSHSHSAFHFLSMLSVSIWVSQYYLMVTLYFYLVDLSSTSSRDGISLHNNVFIYNCLVKYISTYEWNSTVKNFFEPLNTENCWNFVCIHTEGLKPWPEASKNQSPGPRPCETLVTALVAWARLGRLRALSPSLHNTNEN